MTASVDHAPAPTAREVAAEFRRGWPVVLAGAIGTAVGLLASTYAFTIFMAPMTAEFGWRRSEVAIALTFYSFGTFLVYPWFGRLYDRFGARRVGTISVLIYAAVQFAATQINASIWSLYAAYAAIGMLGGGTGYLAYARAVTARFDKGRGLALALTMIGPSLAAVLAPLLLPHVVQAYGWRAGFVAMGLAALIALPLMLFMVGAPVGSAASGDGAPREASGLTIGQAVRTRPFWHMAFGVGLSALGVVGIQLHFVSMTGDLGLSVVRAGQALSLLGLGALLGRFLTGVLVDRFHAPFVAAAFILTPAVCIGLFQLQGVAVAPLMAFGIGVALGAESDLLGFMVSRYFGLKSYSEVFGWLYGIFAIGASLSPLLAGAIYELTGSYAILRTVAAVLCIAGALSYATAGKYRRYDSEPDPA